MALLLSVAIITLNEEANLARTLESVRWADEIVIVDSGSTDRTVEIARGFGARVIERPWPGFAQQKNFAIEKCSGAWVLTLDADEELSPELQSQIRTLLPSGPRADAFYLRRRNLFLGRWIKRGSFYPDAKLRLFRRSAANFSTSLQFEDRPVHETITFDGIADTLDFDLIHHAYPTLHTYIEHMDRYSTLGADILIENQRVGSLAHGVPLQRLSHPAGKLLLELLPARRFSRRPRGPPAAPLPRHLHQLEVRQSLGQVPPQRPAITRHLPGDRLAKVEEPARRPVLRQRRQLHLGLRAIHHIHRRAGAAHVSLHPPRVGGVHLDFRAAQLMRQVDREHV